MLDYNFCVKLIKRLTLIMDKDINIMGLDGVIIASSNEKRINTFHEGARLCGSSNRNVVINSSNRHMYRGCQEGINMPITYDNKVVGVVGITGTVEEVLPYGPLIKEIVELIVNESDTELSKKVKKNNVENYFKDLIQGIEIQDLDAYYSRAKLLDLNISDSRKMVVLKVKEEKDDIMKKIYEDIEGQFKKLLYNVDVEILNLSNKKLVLLFRNCSDVEGYIEKFKDRLSSKKINNYIFIIGEDCNDILDYKRAYSQISLVNSIQTYDTKKKFINVKDYDLKLLMKGISKEFKTRYIKTYFPTLFQGEDKITEDMIKTIKVYFTNNMRVSETSKVMYVHRNTITYRLNKFKLLYDVDLTKPYECTKIYLAILIYEDIKRELKNR
ncbi:CdaR family transcriptional regulator [Clostridium sp. MB05]|uniref:CdaR family transcriptional regulator n=1 Tax=Clostridium sp. MB05 TaxID=3376682 RepID=UPI003981A53D